MATQAQTKFERLAVEIRTPIARITLSNPPLNVIDLPLMDELATVLAQLDGQHDVSVLVLSGEGKCFSAGVDVAAHTPDQIARMLEKFHAAIRALVATKKVTIAAVRGHCLGGGAELAMVCDMVYTDDDAQWGFPEIQLGCFPPVAVAALASLIGQKHAADLILTGRTISGAEAAQIGLANRAAASTDLERIVSDALGRVAKLSPTSLAITKKSLYTWDAMHFDKGLARAEKIYLDELIQSEDAQEGITAFMQKRAPKWKAQ